MMSLICSGIRGSAFGGRYQPVCRWGLALALALGLASNGARGQAVDPNVVVATGITFTPLATSQNFAPYSGHTEGDFVVTPTPGSRWFVSAFRGTPAPSIFAGPTNAPVISSIFITDNVGPFRLTSFDYSSNFGDSTYTIQWFVGEQEFDESGVLFDTEYDSPPFSFRTLVASHPELEADSMYITIIPGGGGATSINIDTIMVATVPEPSGLWLLGLPLAALLHRRKLL
jgi:hypothetical protein